MTITIAGIEFENHGYDARGDVLYVDVEGYRGPPPSALASDEGHNVEWDESGRVIAMTIVGARWWLERDGELRITLPAELLRSCELAGLGGSAALRASEAELARALQTAA